MRAMLAVAKKVRRNTNRSLSQGETDGENERKKEGVRGSRHAQHFKQNITAIHYQNDLFILLKCLG